LTVLKILISFFYDSTKLPQFIEVIVTTVHIWHKLWFMFLVLDHLYQKCFITFFRRPL